MEQLLAMANELPRAILKSKTRSYQIQALQEGVFSCRLYSGRATIRIELICHVKVFSRIFYVARCAFCDSTIGIGIRVLRI